MSLKNNQVIRFAIRDFKITISLLCLGGIDMSGLSKLYNIVDGEGGQTYKLSFCQQDTAALQCNGQPSGVCQVLQDGKEVLAGQPNNR